VRNEHDAMVGAMRRYLEARAIERATRAALAGALPAATPPALHGAAADAAVRADALHTLASSPDGQPVRADALPPEE
jgi:hypothetical protein